MTPNDRTEPGVCTKCQGTGSVIESTLLYTWRTRCPVCKGTGQQPAQHDKSHVTYNSDGSVSIDIKAHAQQYVRDRRKREYPKDPVTNGVVQPAQPACGCVYATSQNTESVRKGFEMGGYVKEFCAEHRSAQPGSGEGRAPYGVEELRRAFEISQETCKGMYVGLPRVTLEASLVGHALRAYDNLQQQLTAARQRIADLESDLETERARGIHTCHDQCPRPLCVAQRRIAAITAMARAQRDCKPPHTSWSPAGMHQMLVQLHDLILKEPS